MTTHARAIPRWRSCCPQELQLLPRRGGPQSEQPPDYKEPRDREAGVPFRSRASTYLEISQCITIEFTLQHSQPRHIVYKGTPFDLCDSSSVPRIGATAFQTPDLALRTCFLTFGPLLLNGVLSPHQGLAKDDTACQRRSVTGSIARKNPRGHISFHKHADTTTTTIITTTERTRMHSYSSPPPPPQLAYQYTPRDVSSLHPVFFTERLQRLPFPPAPAPPSLSSSPPSPYHHTSPVAHGYMYHETRRRAAGSSVPRL